MPNTVGMNWDEVGRSQEREVRRGQDIRQEDKPRQMVFLDGPEVTAIRHELTRVNAELRAERAKLDAAHVKLRSILAISINRQQRAIQLRQENDLLQARVAELETLVESLSPALPVAGTPEEGRS